MNSQKKIEINQSSLLGLKAELLRKKNEVSSAKYAQEINKVKISKKKFVTKLEKSNEGVSERDQRDAEEIAQEVDDIKKSQSALEAKAKLYDKLVNNSSSEIDTSNFLVDFKQKNSEEASVINNEEESEAIESDYGEYNDDDDDEWVDFVDCLGRTKRCHRDDLDAMKEQNEKLKISLYGEPKKAEKSEESDCEIKLPQLCSEDMRKEILRQKWEEQERNLLDKKNVHYQDVLFDEARTHGVGYYGFSTDEAERVRQQEELRKLRKETEALQAEALTAAQRKQKQMEERLKAARRRKRERLGLPPEEEEEEKNETEEVKEEEKKAEPPEELRRDVRKPGPIRPWDIGKDNMTKVLSQEEWVEKKRSERLEEFAPPMSFSRVKNYPKKQKTEKFQKTHQESYEPIYSSMEPVPIDDELDVKETRGRGAEIPPPPIFDLYGSTSKSKKTFSTLSQSEIDKSIEEGLNFLRKQVEEKQTRRRRDEIDIM